MTARAAPAAAVRPAAPTDDLGIGWHHVPGRRGVVRWWNGTDWAGRDHAVPIVPSRRGPRGGVLAGLAVVALFGVPLVATMVVQGGTEATDFALWATFLVLNGFVFEVARGIVARSVATRAPLGIGHPAWVSDPSHVHTLRWWDGHRHTEWVADESPELAGHAVMGVDAHTGPQFEPPRAAWECFATGAWLGALLAIVGLVSLFGLVVGSPAMAVLSISCVWVCVRNARHLHEPVPPPAIVGMVLLGALVPLTLFSVAMWNAVGNAH